MFLTKEGQPREYQRGNIRLKRASLNGHLAAGTPGLVAGLIKIHREQGLLPRAAVLQPAITLAEQGFPVYRALVEAIKAREEVLRAFPATRAIFFPQGKPLKVGEQLRQRDLAKTLRLVAEKGHAGFYSGEVSRRILESMKQGGGIISQKDLEQYEVIQRKPIESRYRKHHIVSMPPPSSGGIHIAQILNILAAKELPSEQQTSVGRLHVLAEAMKRAFSDRAKYLGDPDFVKVPTQGLVSPAYAATLRASIDPQKATPARTLANADPSQYESASTTHLSVVDRWGNAVSSTQTINYLFGSGVVVDGTGIILNNEMDDFSDSPKLANAYGLRGNEANAVAAKKTMLSSMSPTFVFDENRQIKLIVGAKGGPRIITSTLQTILNVIDGNMSLSDAVHYRRIHHQWMPDQIFYEAGTLAPTTVHSLKQKGTSLRRKEDHSEAFRPSCVWVSTGKESRIPGAKANLSGYNPRGPSTAST